METHWRVVGSQRLLASELLPWQIAGVADEWEAQMPQVHPNLIGATGAGGRLDQGLAIGKVFQDAKRGLCGVAAISVDHPEAMLGRPAGDWLSGEHLLPVRLADDATEVGLRGGRLFELSLNRLR